MADASDSKSDVGDYVWVQVPSPALEKSAHFKGKTFGEIRRFFLFVTVLTSTLTSTRKISGIYL